MRAYLAAATAAAAILTPLLLSGAIPALAQPAVWAPYQKDGDDYNGNGNNRNTELTGCVLRVEGDRRFTIESPRGAIEVRVTGANRDLDDSLRTGEEVRANGRYNGNGVYIADTLQRVANGNRDRDDNACANANSYKPYVPQRPVNPYPNGQYPTNPSYPGQYPGQYPNQYGPYTPNGTSRVIEGRLLSVQGGSLVMRSAAGYNVTVYFNNSTQVLDANSNSVGIGRLRAGEAITVSGPIPSAGVLDANSIRIRS